MKTKKQWVLFISGVIAIAVGVSIICFFAARKIYHEYRKQKLLRENPVVEIPALDIKAPILEGTDNDTLSIAAGHFTGTGDFGKGNYCIAGHSSTIYKEYFNDLKYIKPGMEILLYDKNKICYTYTVTESFIVEPSETSVLADFGDDRITIITCTDSGEQRQVVVGTLKNNEKKEASTG